jgi:hypothetical protein
MKRRCKSHLPNCKKGQLGREMGRLVVCVQPRHGRAEQTGRVCKHGRHYPIPSFHEWDRVFKCATLLEMSNLKSSLILCSMQVRALSNSVVDVLRASMEALS